MNLRGKVPSIGSTALVRGRRTSLLRLAALVGLSAGSCTVPPVLAAQTYAERFTTACEGGPLIEVLLQHSLTEDKTRAMFCGCFVEEIGNLSPPEEDFVIRLLTSLETSAQDQQSFADTGQQVEIAFEQCIAALELDPPRD